MPYDRPTPAPRSWLLLAALFLAYACSSVDRYVIGLLIEPIKRDLGATDTEIGLLQGFAFLLVYGVAGLPAGYLADRTVRVRLVSAAVAFWSLMTGLCGLASSYWTLFLARAGVGVGESVLSPASYSLIADSFPEDRQGLALGIYVCGASFGAGLSLIASGYIIAALTAHGPLTVLGLVTLQPWQQTFVLLGLPGLLIAALLLWLREPARKAARAVDDAPSVADYARFAMRNRWALGFHHLASGLSNLVTLATTTWAASLMIRVHGWRVDNVGLAVGLATVCGGVCGLLFGGAASDFAFRRGPHLRLVFCAAMAAVGALAGFGLAAPGGPILAMAFYGVALGCAVAAFASANAALQFLLPGRVRGFGSAVYFLSFSIVGSFGPTLAAMTSDQLFPFRTGIRFALALVVGVGFIAAALCYGAAALFYPRTAPAPLHPADLEPA